MSSLQQQIIARLRVKPAIDPATEITQRVDFIAAYLRSSGAKALVLGISGGQDSTLAGRLCQLAVEKVRTAGGSAAFYALRLPHAIQFDAADAEAALAFIRPDKTLEINIAAQSAQVVSDVQAALAVGVGGAGAGAVAGGEFASCRRGTSGDVLSDFHRGNVKARMRMVTQYTVAAACNGLVVGTDHAAEALIGFYTKHGDGAADLLPLAGLTKGQGKQLLAFLGAKRALWEKIPTADLLDGQPGQADEDSIGVSYADIDTYLTGGKISPDAQQILEQKYLISEHKRQLPATMFDSWWQQ